MTAPSVRDDLAGLEGYHSPQVAVDVRLNTNESPYPPPAAWREAFLEELATLPLHRYPDRSARGLRAALGELHGVGPEQVFAANGSNEVLQAVCLAYGGRGRAAAVFEPTYALHGHIARVTGTEVVVGERRPDFTLDLDEVRRVFASAGPAITFLCSPNNPTVTVDRTEDTSVVVAAAPGLVVVDEAYGQFAPRSSLDDVVDDGPLVVVRTFSKTWALAGLRLGYCVAPARVVAALEGVTLPYHLDAAKQAAGRLALRFAAEMEARVATLVAERERLARALAALPVDLWPSGANFILFRPRHRDGDEVWQGLVDRSVLVRNCASWPRLAGCLRVTVGRPDEDDAFVAALTEVLSTAPAGAGAPPRRGGGDGAPPGGRT
jgi:histidinol-phosphate aminotransferase